MPAPSFMALRNDETLKSLLLSLEIGRVKNLNKNPIVENAILELEEELSKQEPTSGPVSQLGVTGRFAHFPVRPESFRPESFRPRVVSPSITWVVSPSYPESFRPLSKFIFYWGYCEKFTIFVSFNEDFVIFKNDRSFINWSKIYILLRILWKIYNFCFLQWRFCYISFKKW